MSWADWEGPLGKEPKGEEHERKRSGGRSLKRRCQELVREGPNE